MIRTLVLHQSHVLVPSSDLLSQRDIGGLGRGGGDLRGIVINDRDLKWISPFVLH